VSVLTLIALAAVLGLVLGHTPAIAQDVAVAVIRYDPFAEPDLTQPPQTRPVASARNQAWSPVLRATLVAGRGSMVNLGGTILNIGDEAHGYRLLEVGEGEAVFSKGDSRLVLTTSQGER
jgi:hypothetical protein